MHWCTLLALCEFVGWSSAQAMYSLQFTETASSDMLACMKEQKLGRVTADLSESAKMVGHCTSISDLPYTTVAYTGAQSM
jgi:uncharacterized protein (UPF0210 family)